MKFVVVKVGKKYLLILGAVFILILLVLIIFYRQGIPSAKMVMGGSYSPQVFEDYEGKPLKRDVNPEEYIRPSKLPAINTRFAGADFFNQYYGKNPNQIKLPDNFLKPLRICFLTTSAYLGMLQMVEIMSIQAVELLVMAIFPTQLLIISSHQVIKKN